MVFLEYSKSKTFHLYINLTQTGFIQITLLETVYILISVNYIRINSFQQLHTRVNHHIVYTLESEINVGSGISVGLGRF